MPESPENASQSDIKVPGAFHSLGMKRTPLTRVPEELELAGPLPLRRFAVGWRAMRAEFHESSGD
jgi:hypothetical protein